MTLVAGGTYRQAPPSTAKLNWQHPLANNLIGLIAGRRIHVGNNSAGVAVSTAINTPTGFGAGYTGPTHSPIALCTLPAQTDTTAWSMAWAGSQTGQNCLGFFVGTHGVIAVVCGATDSGLNFTDTTGFQAIVTSATPGRDCVIVVTKDGTVFTSFVGSPGGAVTKASANPGAGKVGLIAQSVFYSSDNFAAMNATSLAAVWTRGLSDAEAESIIANPFQMIAV